MSDIAYYETRRQGIRATIVRVPSATANPETGERVGSTQPINVRLVVKEQTSYQRLIKAQAAQQDIGSTTFIFWTRDIPGITRLDVEDYIIANGVKHQVVTSVVEGTSFVVTTNEHRGAVGKQQLSLDATNSLSVDQTNNPVVTP